MEDLEHVPVAGPDGEPLRDENGDPVTVNELKMWEDQVRQGPGTPTPLPDVDPDPNVEGHLVPGQYFSSTKDFEKYRNR